MEKIEILKKNYLFENIPVSYFPKIVKYFKKETINEDKELFKEGDSWDKLYLIGKGKVSIILNIDDIGQEGVAVLEGKEFFGEMAILDNGKRSATVIARKGAVLLSIEGEDFKKLISKNSENATIILSNLVKKISARIRHTSDKLNSFHLMDFSNTM